MQRWEYLTIFIRDVRWSDSSGREGTLPGGGRLSGSSGHPTGLLNEFGEQGWELVGVVTQYGWSFYEMILKRPHE
jgi:hypothetical protein